MTLAINQQPEFQIILSEHAAAFQQEVFKAYEKCTTREKKFTNNIPSLLNVFVAYETFADTTFYGAGLLNKENDSADYYQTVKDTMGAGELAVVLRELVAQKQQEENTNQFDQMLWNDMFEAMQRNHICHTEIVKEKEGRDVQVFYRHLPFVNIW